jgi:hypothetical protein
MWGKPASPAHQKLVHDTRQPGALTVHYRLRFDPAIRTADTRRTLRDESGARLKQCR